MICSHCEKEVEEYAQKRDKICGPCYRRMMNCLSRGKEYIMYKNLSEAEKTEIDLRLQNYKKSKNQESKVSNSKCVELANKAKQEELINKDIEEAFNKKGYIIPKDFSSVRGVFEQLDVLLSNYIDKYLNGKIEKFDNNDIEIIFSTDFGNLNRNVNKIIPSIIRAFVRYSNRTSCTYGVNSPAYVDKSACCSDNISNDDSNF